MPRRSPAPEGPLQAALRNLTTAAATRASEGHDVFGPIAVFLDQHRNQVSSDLPPHLRIALASLSEELASVAQRHFNAFISGMSISRKPESPTALPLDQPAPTPYPTPVQLPGLAQSTYARAASLPALSEPSTAVKPRPRALLPKQKTPDNRLFVRLPDVHQARGLHPYAIYSSLRARLGPNGALLKEVQPTKTGFALCPSTPDGLALLEDQRDNIATFFGDCQVERGSHWVSYRVTNVPRLIGQISASNEYTLVPVDSKAMALAVTESTGFAPASVSETSFSASNPNLPTSSWFVNFPEGFSSTLPHQLRVFGVTANARLLARKLTTVQCNRCWNWHNTRSCARPPRCRLCGSTEHPEEKHSNRCAAPLPHQCPPRCLHCHGPHPADTLECPLRPSPTSTARTKTQQLGIRKSCSAALALARSDRGCITLTPSLQATTSLEANIQDEMAVDNLPTPSQPATPPPPMAHQASQPMTSPFRAITPPPPSPLTAPPPTQRSVRFASPQPQNRFTILLGEEL
jgi:hypothetical protein